MVVACQVRWGGGGLALLAGTGIAGIAGWGLLHYHQGVKKTRGSTLQVALPITLLLQSARCRPS